MKTSPLFALLWLCSLAWSLPAQEAAGTIKSLRGDTQLERDGIRRAVRPGETLYVKDRLLTGADGQMSVGLRDQSSLAIGPRSDVDLSKYQFNPVTHLGEQVVHVRSGTLAAISGKMAKASPQSVQFNTGTVTLGVRGTQFVIEAYPAPSAHDAPYWTDGQQRVIRSGDGLCWQNATARVDTRSDCTPSRFVLLPDRDGSVGRIVASSESESHLVSTPYSGLEWGFRELHPVTFTATQIRARYQGVLDGLPPAPKTFVVRFTPGRSDQLMNESWSILNEAREAVTHWPVPADVDVVGHTDTTGTSEENDKLSWERAQTVARWLNAPDPASGRIHASGRGERQLLVQTPDETHEPANRRVEITVY